MVWPTLGSTTAKEDNFIQNRTQNHRQTAQKQQYHLTWKLDKTAKAPLFMANSYQGAKGKNWTTCKPVNHFTISKHTGLGLYEIVMGSHQVGRPLVCQGCLACCCVLL